MLIKVTQDHINRGQKEKLYRGSRCPLALAIKEHFPRIAIIVLPDWVMVGRKNIRLPKSAYEFRVRADRGMRVKPFEFELEVEFGWERR